ncbi:WhiB family transcriptional regulator [Actinotignum urinale]|uniref:Transcriptional regulator WhiB n=1 Tax=Actinotignum urinale TaxID=190146 RepID=A0ABU5GAT6_9ACTO|nr:WhiB family transcriptional regulator [Actinotignum urinale]MDY5133780.1 WhiB family transcriptional regulator [Actinotignum urinale]
MNQWSSQWNEFASCANSDPEALFVQGSAQKYATSICADCPVRERCLAEALEYRLMYGVWGGMTERERRALLKSHPEHTDWFKTIQNGKNRLSQRTPARKTRDIHGIRSSRSCTR